MLFAPLLTISLIVLLNALSKKTQTYIFFISAALLWSLQSTEMPCPLIDKFHGHIVSHEAETLSRILLSKAYQANFPFLTAESTSNLFSYSTLTALYHFLTSIDWIQPLAFCHSAGLCPTAMHSLSKSLVGRAPLARLSLRITGCFIWFKVFNWSNGDRERDLGLNCSQL